ncbi:MAG: response regulator transcription factor [Clostridia bacterium]|nr:response regulator transcription factor [Clostridia bacterium]
MRVLVIEDERRLAGTLADIIEEMGYGSAIRTDGIQGLDEAMTGIYDAIVLDVMLPGMNGFEILRQLRQAKIETPVLMLTARSELADRVEGLNSGADYYLTKPFEIPEFQACLRAVIRRQGQIIPEIKQFDDLSLSLTDGRLSCGSRSLVLSSKEKDIISLLFLNPQVPVSKEIIITKVWGFDSDAGDNNVEAYISFLRKKLTLLGSNVQITAQRRIGYRLEASHS